MYRSTLRSKCLRGKSEVSIFWEEDAIVFLRDRTESPDSHSESFAPVGSGFSADTNVLR